MAVSSTNPSSPISIIPTISINPLNNEVDIAFQTTSSQMPLIEDVLNLIEKLSNEKKNSSFYHFGMLLPLGKIPRNDFKLYLNKGLQNCGNDINEITEAILDFSGCHPYYTQQLAFVVWEILQQDEHVADSIKHAISALVSVHDMDYERIWNGFNKTDKKLLIGLSLSDLTPLSEAFYRKFEIGSPSTAFSSLKRLLLNGYITKTDNKYGIDDPFFCQWLKQRRAQ